MRQWLDDVLRDAATRFDEVRAELRHADVTAAHRDTVVQRRSALVRATAYVLISAALERGVKDALRGLIDELALLALPTSDVALPLFSLLASAQFQSIAATSGLNQWESRLELLDVIGSSGIAQFSTHVLPLDNRTLRATHLALVWGVLGLPNSPVPSSLHAAAMKDLAEGRNAVAHGNEDAVSFGRARNAADVDRLLGRIEDVFENMILSIEEYLNTKGYRR